MSKNAGAFYSYTRRTCHATVPYEKVIICIGFYGRGVTIIVHKLFSHTTGGKVQLFSVKI